MANKTISDIVLWVFRIFGGGLILIGIILFKVSPNADKIKSDVPPPDGLTTLFVGLILCVIGGFIMRFGKRFSAYFLMESVSSEELDEVVKNKNNILYLRSFITDFFESGSSVGYLKYFNPVAFFADDVSKEEKFVEILQPHGKVVCLGDPDELLPKLGAQRYYIRGTHWIDFITKAITHCKYLIMLWGNTDNVKYEIELVIQKQNLIKLKIMVNSEEKLKECLSFLNEILKKYQITSKIPTGNIEKKYAVISFDRSNSISFYHFDDVLDFPRCL